MTETEKLSQTDHDVIATTSRDYWRGRLTELCSVVNDSRGQLSDGVATAQQHLYYS